MKTLAGSRDTVTSSAVDFYKRWRKRSLEQKEVLKKSFLSVKNEKFSLPQTYQVLGRGGAWITALARYEKISLQGCKQYRADMKV